MGLSGLSGLSGPSGLFGGIEIPLTIDGLQLWLKADAGTFQDSAKTTAAASDGDVVGAWVDQSGNNKDVLQVTTANKPLLKLAILNDRPIIRFDGVNDSLVSDIFDADLDQPSTIFIVLEVKNAEGDKANIYVGIEANKQHQLFTRTAATPDAWRMFAGNNFTDGSATKNAVILMVSEFDGASSEIWENGVSLGTGNAGTDPVSAISLSATVSPLDGDIAEFLLYNVTLSDVDRGIIEDYLNERYAIF